MKKITEILIILAFFVLSVVFVLWMFRGITDKPQLPSAPLESVN